LGGHWLVREISLYWKRTLKRLDVSSRSLFGFIKHGSCFAGFLTEILFATDQVYMAEGEFDDDDRPAPSIILTASNFGPYPMPNDITRLEARFFGNPDKLKFAKDKIGVSLNSDGADEAELITFAYDDIDWDDEIRILLEERKSFSPDALTGMEANLRFVGPETMESKIFSRLTAWQNWIFQRPNAVGEDGALKNYGTGDRPKFDFERV
jgi:benzoyl-CoA-dihydrodiol lyase